MMVAYKIVRLQDSGEDFDQLGPASEPSQNLTILQSYMPTSTNNTRRLERKLVRLWDSGEVCLALRAGQKSPQTANLPRILQSYNPTCLKPQTLRAGWNVRLWDCEIPERFVRRPELAGHPPRILQSYILTILHSYAPGRLYSRWWWHVRL